ncbi:expressed unknown protein [Seminavis robusta]|uniref:F-box domain-containing protein n=1 Tax=Seminavis robusta TaxID=568900 RepID=A0A9N8H363_9STRA|nr:expressed unknown protein [Seminavis robusta]|eukprot:Sro32_g020720.1 n/a (303) ;mRNA; f:41477-42385
MLKGCTEVRDDSLVAAAAFPLMRLPAAMLPTLLDYLPLDEVASLMLVCKAFQESGKVTIRRKLRRAGAEDVIKQNLRLKHCLSMVLENSKLISSQNPKNSDDRGVQVKVFILGCPRCSKLERAMKRLLDCPNLAERFAHRAISVDGSVINLGVGIRQLPLRVRVLVKQYRKELEFQKDSIRSDLFPRRTYLALMRSLEKVIQTMKEYEKHPQRPYTWVFYLPRLQNHPFETTIYDSFVEQTKEPLSKRGLVLKGIGRGNDQKIAVCPKVPSLAFTVAKSELNAMFEFAMQKIEDNVDRVKAL